MAGLPGARGVFLRKNYARCYRHYDPHPANTHSIAAISSTLVGRTQDTTAEQLWESGRPTDVADVRIYWRRDRGGALVGALVLKVHGVPLTLSLPAARLSRDSCSGWLRSTRPFFGRIPSPTVWFMNSVASISSSP